MAAADRAGGTPEPAVRPSPPVWLFWSAACLALVLVGVKALYLAARVDPGAGDRATDLPSLAAITYRDLAFVLAAWACARVAVVIVGHRVL